MYKVIKFFTDLQDYSHPYHVGDEFPRKGLKVSEARLAQLAGANNRQRVPLIKKVTDEETSKVLYSTNPAQPKEVVQEPPQEEVIAEKPEKSRSRKKEDK